MSGFVKNENRKPPKAMCDSVKNASLKCSETKSKFDCQVFFEAATKCRSEKQRLDEEEQTIKKYLKDDITTVQKQSLQKRIDEINEIRSKQYPVPI